MAGSDIKLKTIDVRGKRVAVFVTSEGKFKAEVDTDDWVYAGSLEDLTKKVMEATRETYKLAIEFWRWEDGELKHGVILGLHGGSNNIRVKLGNDRAGQEYPWDAQPHKYLKLDESQRKTYIQLCEYAERAEAVKKEYERSHTFDAVKAIRAELAGSAGSESAGSGKAGE